jgi:hypothetical protein
VFGGIPFDDEEVGSLAGCDDAAVVEAEDSSGDGGGCGEASEWGESVLDEEFELTVEVAEGADEDGTWASRSWRMASRDCLHGSSCSTDVVRTGRSTMGGRGQVRTRSVRAEITNM